MADLTQAAFLGETALSLARAGETGRALESARHAASESSGAWAPLSPLVQYLHRTGNWEQALLVLRHAHLLAPEAEPDLTNAIGCCELALGRPDRALGFLHRASGACPAFLANYGAVLLRMERRSEAAEVLARASSADPTDARADRLALLASASDPAGWLTTTAGTAQGHLFPMISLSREPSRTGDAISLEGDRDEAWTLKSAGLEEAPAEGAPALASVWNEAGLFVKTGRIEAVRADALGVRFLLRGPEACRIQRRRHFRMLAAEGFVEAERMPDKGTSRGSPVFLRDLSACGLSFYHEAESVPPRPGDGMEFRLTFEGVQFRLSAVVRQVRKTPRALLACAELQGNLPTENRIARLLHERQRLLRNQASRTRVAV